MCDQCELDHCRSCQEPEEASLPDEEGWYVVACCCGRRTWQAQTLEGEYAEYAREVAERYGYDKATGEMPQ